MTETILQYICSQPINCVLRSLVNNPKPIHLRRLAKIHQLSPAGIAHILQSFNRLGVLQETRVGNRRCYSLKISQLEKDGLKKFFLCYENSFIFQRSVKLSRQSTHKLNWIDETLQFYQKHRVKMKKRQ